MGLAYEPAHVIGISPEKGQHPQTAGVGENGRQRDTDSFCVVCLDEGSSLITAVDEEHSFKLSSI